MGQRYLVNLKGFFLFWSKAWVGKSSSPQGNWLKAQFHIYVVRYSSSNMHIYVIGVVCPGVPTFLTPGRNLQLCQPFHILDLKRNLKILLSLLHVSLKISFLDFLCRWCCAPVCSARHFSSLRNVFSLLATVKHPQLFRCSDGIIWNWFPCSGSDAYDGITKGMMDNAVLFRHDQALLKTPRSPEKDAEMIFCATGSNRKPRWTHKCRNQRQVNVKAAVDIL